MTKEQAIEIREELHKVCNLFGKSAQLNEEEAKFKLGQEAKYAINLAEQMKIGLHLVSECASKFSDLVEIEEHGDAWHNHTLPDGVHIEQEDNRCDDCKGHAEGM